MYTYINQKKNIEIISGGALAPRPPPGYATAQGTSAVKNYNKFSSLGSKTVFLFSTAFTVICRTIYFF